MRKTSQAEEALDLRESVLDPYPSQIVGGGGILSARDFCVTERALHYHFPHSRMIHIGHPIPNFTAEAYQDGKISTVSLDQYRGQWLIMAFYPADFTFVCPTELGELAGRYDEFKKLKTEIVSISTDKAYTHAAWHDASPIIKTIQYPMIADPKGEICRAFGTYIEGAGESLRGTFIVDPDGILRTMDVHDNSIGRSTDEILRKLQAAQYVREHGNEVCPASWRPGQKTLTPGVAMVGKL